LVATPVILYIMLMDLCGILMLLLQLILYEGDGG